MSDLVERLKFAASWSETEIDIAGPDLLKQAANEIDRLRAALEWYAKDYDHALGCSQWDGGARARATLAVPSDQRGGENG